MAITPISIQQANYGISGTRPTSSGVQPAAGAVRGSALPEESPAYVRHGGASRGGIEGLYGPDARVRSISSTRFPTGLESPEDQAADERTLNKLEARDRQVRQNAKEQGRTAGDENLIYQTGPDGEQYAIGSKVHVVRKDADSTSVDGGTGTAGTATEKLSTEDEQLVEDLKARDNKVRQHEAAHMMAAGGQAVSGPTYVYQTGPDGQRYAIGGSVHIAMGSSSGDPETAAREARKAHRAAMATGGPSAADMNTAQRALTLESRAQQRGLDTYARYALSPEGQGAKEMGTAF